MEILKVDYNFNLESNMETVRNNIVDDIKRYDVIVTDDSVEGAKEFMASINKDKKLFNDTCKEFIDKISDPITKFKTSQKEISELFDTARSNLKIQVFAFDIKKLKVIEQVVKDYRNSVCMEREINPEAINIDDLILLGSVTAGMKVAKKTRDAIEMRIQLVENEILKARLELEEKNRRDRETQTKARLEAEEKARLREIELLDQADARAKFREQELIKQAEIQKDNALKKQKQELEQQNTQVEIKTAPTPSTDPNKKIAILTFEFDIKGEVPDEKIIDRIKSQISKDFINYLVNVEVM